MERSEHFFGVFWAQNRWVWEIKQLRAVLANVALITLAVTSRVTQRSAFDVSDYMSHGDPGDPSKYLNVLEQMEILVDVVIKVIGKGAESVESMARVEVRREGFKKGVEAVKKHEQECTNAIRIPSNRARIEKLINKYIVGWTFGVRCIRVGRGKKDLSARHRAASLCPGPELGGASSLHQRGRAKKYRGSACRGSRSISRTIGQAGKDAGRVAVFFGRASPRGHDYGSKQEMARE